MLGSKLLNDVVQEFDGKLSLRTVTVTLELTELELLVAVKVYSLVRGELLE